MTPTRSRFRSDSSLDDDVLDKLYKDGLTTSGTSESDSDCSVVSTASTSTTFSKVRPTFERSALTTARTAAAKRIHDPHNKDKQKQGAGVLNYFNKCNGWDVLHERDH